MASMTTLETPKRQTLEETNSWRNKLLKKQTPKDTNSWRNKLLKIQTPKDTNS